MKINIYHGSEKVISVPQFGYGSNSNDDGSSIVQRISNWQKNGLVKRTKMGLQTAIHWRWMVLQFVI